MPRPTIDYLNARREANLSTSRRTYRSLPVTRETMADAKARLAGMDAFELIREETYHRFAAMRSSDKERLNLWQSRLNPHEDMEF